MKVEIKLKQSGKLPADHWINHNQEQRIEWHKKKIELAKAMIMYHETELKRLTT